VWDLQAALAEADVDTSKPANMRVTAAVAAHDKDINTLAVSPNDALVVTASQDRTAKVGGCWAWGSHPTGGVARRRAADDRKPRSLCKYTWHLIRESCFRNSCRHCVEQLLSSFLRLLRSAAGALREQCLGAVPC